MGSKLPDDLKWTESAAALLAETDKTSAKSVCITVKKAAEAKETKEAAMEAIICVCKWAKEAGVFWTEPYVVALLPTVMALCADKAKPVQVKAEEAGEAFMGCLNPAAVDAMLLLLFKQFEEHRWQTKLAAVKMFSALAKSSTNAVVANLPEVVRKLMEVSQAGRSQMVSFPEVPLPKQDPKALIKETAIVALTSCCSVIDNPDVVPLIDSVISANVNPDTEGESCLDRLVATTYVNNVDKPTLAIIVPILLRGLRVRGNVNMQRKAAIVIDTMCKLVKDPEDIAPFASEVIPDLEKNAEEIAIPEVRERTAEALNTIKVAVGEFSKSMVSCDPVEVEAILAEITTGNAYSSDEVTQWISQVTAPLFRDCRPHTRQFNSGGAEDKPRRSRTLPRATADRSRPLCRPL